MNYLQLCQKARELSSIPGTGPVSVLSQTGELARLCGWVAQSWIDIQNLHDDWLWMKKEDSFNTTSGKGTYTSTDASISNFSRWINHSFSIYSTATGKSAEVHLTQIPYDAMKATYLFGASAAMTGQPAYVAVHPDKSLVLWPTPDREYTIELEFYSDVTELTADASVPEMPARFHIGIVHHALVKYGYFEAASEVIQEHTTRFAAVKNRLEAEQLPTVTIG